MFSLPRSFVPEATFPLLIREESRVATSRVFVEIPKEEAKTRYCYVHAVI